MMMGTVKAEYLKVASYLQQWIYLIRETSVDFKRGARTRWRQ